jgi:hypothetical protein
MNFTRHEAMGRAAPGVLSFLLLAGCGGISSVGAIGGDGGMDSAKDVSAVDAMATTDSSTTDGASPSDSPAAEASMPQAYDGTTGKACASDADCKNPNGPGMARCSNSVFSPEQYYPSPVCILPTCSPVSGQALHFCDGPDAPSSPGVCVPNGPQAGICLPRCSFDKSGSAATGCLGKDACWSYSTGLSTGVGYCWAGCTSDGDCSGGQKCQTDQGLCVQGVVPPIKPWGAACTQADSQNGACNCFLGNGNTGYCTSFCTVGGNGCPGGATCDAFEFRQYGFTTQNQGLAGDCTYTCGGLDGGPGCPGSATCTNTYAAGPDCIP